MFSLHLPNFLLCPFLLSSNKKPEGDVDDEPMLIGAPSSECPYRNSHLIPSTLSSPLTRMRIASRYRCLSSQHSHLHRYPPLRMPSLNGPSYLGRTLTRPFPRTQIRTRACPEMPRVQAQYHCRSCPLPLNPSSSHWPNDQTNCCSASDVCSSRDCMC